MSGKFDKNVAYNLNVDGSVSLESPVVSGFDTSGNALSYYLGGNAIPTYCLIDFSAVTGDNATAIKAIFDRDNDLITDGDNKAYPDYDLENDYLWSVETLLRQPEFIRSLQDDWHVFLKQRTTDEALEQLVVYSETTDYATRAKILKATKDTTTDARDHKAYINCGELAETSLKTGSAMLDDAGAPSVEDEVVATVHDIVSDREYNNDASVNPRPILKKDVNDKFYLDFTVADTDLTATTEIDGTYNYAKDRKGLWHVITLADTDKLQRADFDFSDADIDYMVYAFISSDTDILTELNS